MMKTAYISPANATLELLLSYQNRPEGLLMLDTGIPNWPNWSIRVPLDTEDADTIMDMAFQAMVDDFVGFLTVLSFSELASRNILAKIMLAFEKIKSSPNPEPDGATASIRADVPLDEDFVNETHRAIVVAAVKRRAPAAPKNRSMEVKFDPPSSKAISEAARVIQRYRNRSLKGQPKPLYILVYNQTGTPVGVQRL